MESRKTLSGVKHPSEEDKYRECSLSQIFMMQDESWKFYTAENTMPLSLSVETWATPSPTEHQGDLAQEMIDDICLLPTVSLLLT